MTGGLPPNLLYGMQNAYEVTISQYAGAEQYQPDGVQCGITGPVPPEWFTDTTDASGVTVTPATSMITIDASNNKLSGSLPDITAWKRLQLLFLSNNQFSGPVPAKWASVAGPVSTVDLQANRLSGVFPREWSDLKGKVSTLTLDDNPGLTGCAPLDASTTVTYENTGMSGVCTADTTEVEAQQVQAVQHHLVPLFGAESSSRAGKAFVDMLVRLVKDVADLRGVLKAGQSNSQFYGKLGASGANTIDITIGVELLQTATYINTIKVNGGGAAGLNLTHLVPFVRSLPRLNTFICKVCNANAQPGLHGPQDLQLPSLLAQAAPLLKYLDLTGCGLQGSLPQSWGSWTSLEALYVPSLFNYNEYPYEEIAVNGLTGSIPPLFANLDRLKFLDVSGNDLTGTLPPEFGSTGKMPDDAVFYLGYTGLRGPIPLSWSYFSLGIVDVTETAVNISCIPDGLQVYPSGSPSCSGFSPQVSTLLSLKKLIQNRGGVSAALATWNGSDIGGAGPKTPPKYCRIWTGITCDSAYQVTGLNLTALSIQLPAAASFNFTRVIDMLQPLSPTLRVLDAATLQLVGELPKVLATFSKLEVLKIRGNKGLTGGLPSIWSALTALRTVDLSSTGISGNLPPSWASLQELRVFRAANCSGVSGQLPLEWGILRSLEELVVTNSQLDGALPAWTDAGAVRAAGAAALSAAERVANDAGDAGLSLASVEQRTRTVRYSSGRVAPQAMAAASIRAVTAIKVALAAAPAGTRFMPLRVVDLSGNKLTGQLVPGWSLFEQLQVLILSRNALSGPLPESYARLTTLTALDLSGNSFAGLLPSTWVSMRQLVFLDVSSNALVSPTPETLPYMAGEGFNLKCLVLFGNAGMDAAELASIEKQMEADSGGRVTVVVSRSRGTCDNPVLGV